jgi:OHCU decarboxylase
MRIDDLNALDRSTAERELLRCCGSSRWARMMAAARPFASQQAMLLTADVVWAALDRLDWLEAFAAHPKIGEAGRAGGPPEVAREWSEQEQSGVTAASRPGLERLNRAYAERFGYLFIVCATGKSGDELRAILERRMTNNPEDELREAGEQQRQITRLRLAKLLT